ncbi:hypothetical protein ACLOJK_020217, partial [Asimina triloba]
IRNEQRLRLLNFSPDLRKEDDISRLFVEVTGGRTEDPVHHRRNRGRNGIAVQVVGADPLSEGRRQVAVSSIHGWPCRGR